MHRDAGRDRQIRECVFGGVHLREVSAEHSLDRLLTVIEGALERGYLLEVVTVRLDPRGDPLMKRTQALNHQGGLALIEGEDHGLAEGAERSAQGARTLEGQQRSAYECAVKVANDRAVGRNHDGARRELDLFEHGLRILVPASSGNHDMEPGVLRTPQRPAVALADGGADRGEECAIDIDSDQSNTRWHTVKCRTHRRKLDEDEESHCEANKANIKGREAPIPAGEQSAPERKRRSSQRPGAGPPGRAATRSSTGGGDHHSALTRCRAAASS